MQVEPELKADFPSRSFFLGSLSYKCQIGSLKSLTEWLGDIKGAFPERIENPLGAEGDYSMIIGCKKQDFGVSKTRVFDTLNAMTRN